MFIKRDAASNVIAVSNQCEPGMLAAKLEDLDAIQVFLRQIGDDTQIKFQQSDLAMARVLEDVIGLLIEKGAIRFTDLPEAAQAKLLTRRELRGQYVPSNLIDDSDDLTL